MIHAPDQAEGLRIRIAEEMARQSDAHLIQVDDDAHHHWDNARIAERLCPSGAGRDGGPGAAMRPVGGGR